VRKTNKDTITLVQGVLRPTIFGAYEYIFPREALPDVISMFEAKWGQYDYKNWRAWRLRFMRPMFGCKGISKKIFKAICK
jgi:hypothetical protein